MPASLESFLNAHPALLRRKTWLLGVSGGLDSVSLLHMLVPLAGKRLRVLHLNHQLRGRSADADAAFVLRLCQKLRVPCRMGKTDVKALAKKHRCSIETAAREARYQFFEKEAGRVSSPALFLAHQADDQIETFLFRLLRGSGTAGLTGMSPVSSRAGFQVIRPLLDWQRSDIEAYAKEHRLKWREDMSNASTDHTRNRIRHELVPLMNDILSRDVRGNLLRVMKILKSEDEALAVSVPPLGLEVKALRDESQAIQRRRIHRWLTDRHKIPHISFDHIEAVRSLIEQNAATYQVNLPTDLHVRRSKGWLKVIRIK